MTKQPAQLSTIPQPILDARKVLDMLRVEGEEIASGVEKALPSYALNLSKSGQEVTVEGLLAAARQGEAFLKLPSAVVNPEDILAAYERIVKKFTPYKEKTLEEQFIAAAEQGDNEKIKSLIEKGIDVTAQGNYANMLAARFAHNDTIRLLIKNGADVRAEDNLAIKLAAWVGHTDTVRLLIENGADVTAEDNLAVIWAAVNGNSDTILLLWEHGADVTAKDNSAIIEAARGGYNDTVRLLIEKGADPSVLSDTDKKTLKAHEEWAVLWQQTVHMEPPSGLHTENPAYFKKACFETVVKMLEKEGYKGKEAHSMAFHTAGLFQSENRVLQYLEKWGAASEQPLHDLVQMIRLPKEGPPNLKDWGDAVLKCGPSMAKLVKYADRISSPIKSSDGKTWSMINTRAECAKHSFKKAAEHPDLATLCFEHDVDEADFNKALKLIQKATPTEKSIPDLTIDGDRFGAVGARFYRLAPDDIRGLFLGEMTSCCQSIGSAGGPCAEHGYTSPDSGFYVVENAKGRIVAQTWAWRGKEGEMCFDSLETLGDNVTADQWKAILLETAKELTTRKDHDVTALHVGTGGATPTDSLRQQFTKSATAKPKDYSGYRDSKEKQIRVWKKARAS